MTLPLLACTSLTDVGLDDPVPSETDADTDADADSDTDADADADSDTDTDTDIGDRAVFDAMVAGDEDVQDGMQTVSSSGGWPLADASTWVFALPDQGWSTVQLAGDMNDWEPQDMALDNGLWWLERDATAGDLYKVVVDGEHHADPWSRAYGYDQYGEYSLVEGTGAHLERWFEVGDTNMPGRTIRVWVPTGAVTHQLYVHDGQNLFDPDAIWGGWDLAPNLSAGTMAIGIDNTSDRFEEYTHVQDDIGGTYGGDADDYANYVLGTVRILVEDEYGAAETRGTMGSSLGGLVSLHIAQTQPDDWDFAGSMSGTLGWGSIGLSNETMIERYAEGYVDVAVFVDSGGPTITCVDSDGDGVDDDSEDWDNYCVTRQFADTAAATGWTWESDLWHWHEPNAEHNEAEWAARAWRPVGIFEGL
ncbi:MAG: hypothetical protein GY884_22905 [Proteobacteria bacterium]|nr:hypothetical protein [Pseudomonadota bacterium]